MNLKRCVSEFEMCLLEEQLEAMQLLLVAVQTRFGAVFEMPQLLRLLPSCVHTPLQLVFACSINNLQRTNN